jgi:hypothetical protein
MNSSNVTKVEPGPALTREASHASWLPGAQEKPEQGFWLNRW